MTASTPAGHTVRDATAADLPALTAWLRPGAARTLPAAEPGSLAAEQWLLAEAQPGTPLACLRLRAAIGLDLPRPWYHVGCVVHAAPALKLNHRQHTLLLGNDHTGCSELADLAWQRDGRSLAQQAAALQALVRGAIARIGAQRDKYASTLIVELPGRRDAQGRSPFWQGLGRHFYAGDPLAAAERFGPDWRCHVAALLPRQPVYASFLAPEAQAAIAQVDDAARLALDTLWHAGLRYGHHITIDDGGPVFEGVVDALAGAPGPLVQR